MYMKKKIVFIMGLLFIVTEIVNAGIYRDQVNNEKINGRQGASYSKSARTSDTNSGYGLYRASGPPGFGGRPTVTTDPETGDGGAIGTESLETPVGDGLSVLVAGCTMLGVVKYFALKQKTRINLCHA
jgi:hypothetical protein